MEKDARGQLLLRAYRSSSVRLIVFCVLTWLGVASLVLFLLQDGRQQVERKAGIEAQGVSAVLEAHLSSVLQRVHSDLEFLAATLPSEAYVSASGATVQGNVVRSLRLRARQFAEVADFRVLDASGLMLSSAQGGGGGTDSFARRDYFAFFERGAASGLFFSEAHTDPLLGHWVLALSVPVHREGGGLAGVIVALLDLSHLSSRFEGVTIGERGVVSLRRVANGEVVLRRPFVAEQVNRPLLDNPMQKQVAAGGRSGLLHFHGTMDGVERVFSYRRLADYPLYVAAGLATEDYLGEWRRTRLFGCLAGLVLFLALALLLTRVLKAGGREAKTAGRLRESEARYRMLAENSHDVIWTVDIPSRCYTYVSPSVAGMTGFSPDELVGQPFDVRLTPDSALRLAREIDLRLRRIASGDRAASVVVSEFELVCKDGALISTEVVSSYLLDADGVARTILGITRNISERKAAEHALKESNRQLHARIEEIGRLQVALQELAVRDSLTGLYNRRYLDETLDREVSRARREGNPLSLVMLDIDYFKRVNDTYGHQVGDEVLRTLAATLSSDIRAEDVPCRYGGEEFLILLPNMPLETAMMRAEAWRAAVESLSIAHGNFQLTFTISLGVSAYPDHGKTPDELTRCADQALYQAKHDGRNRVSVHSH